MRGTKKRRSRANGVARANGHTTALVAPAPERFRPDHIEGGVILRSVETVRDANGGIGRPWQKLDALARMERAGSISKSMRAAGLYFNKRFNEAGLDPLGAADPMRAPVLSHNGQLTAHHGSSLALKIVIDSLDRLGGFGSLGASAAWGILGCEMTIESWGLSCSWAGRSLNPQVATGILLNDLDILQRYYRMA